MALYKQFGFSCGGQVGVWKVTESLQALESAISLADAELAVYQQFRFEARKKEWLAVRCLLSNMLGYYVPVHYLPSGKPYIDGYHISISHTKGYVGVSLSEKPTAIDLEYPSSRVEPLVHRFVSDAEMSMVDPGNKALSYLLIWSAKEALYKLYDQPGVIFNQDLYVQGLSLAAQGSMIGGIRMDGFESETQLFFHVEDDLIIVYC